MFHLQGPQVLQMLEKSLRKSIPESLKVYGTVFHMNQGDPFKLKALVDKWPDFTTVVIRPQEEEMTDDFDHYTNTYQVYSKNPQNCQEFLGASGIINWKQHLQIQSSQSSLNEVIQNLAAVKLVKVKQKQGIMYMLPETASKLLPSLLEAKNLPLKSGRRKVMTPPQHFSTTAVAFRLQCSVRRGLPALHIPASPWTSALPQWPRRIQRFQDYKIPSSGFIAC
ncbi:glycine N-phenylacetyltransferase-like isoform X2 [Callorhinus ursinus]|uniref:glycine N-phenylacetyltransferase-like isoform X2 n=1 Tax=Callorhinus ursinus TaxID=34884 RepID=UPI003CD04BE0